MPDLSAQLETLKTDLAAAMPTRVVTRDFKDFSQRKKEDLAAGILTIVSLGEGKYSNVMGREAQSGTATPMLLGQIKVAEQSDSSAIEAAELAFIEEIKEFFRLPAVSSAQILMLSFRQSGQIEHPYGWFVVEMEMDT